jgi:micrococcal nuclease
VVGAVLALGGALSRGAASAAGSGAHRVLWVPDGDTIKVAYDGGEVLVRYIGIDAPETRHSRRGEQPGGEEAMHVNRGLVDRRSVTLEFDRGRRDDHGRLLAYVWVVGADGRRVMANAEMIARGYARAIRVPPNLQYARYFARLEDEARRARRGLWAPGGPWASAAARAGRITTETATGPASPDDARRADSPARPATAGAAPRAARRTAASRSSRARRGSPVPH